MWWKEYKSFISLSESEQYVAFWTLITSIWLYLCPNWTLMKINEKPIHCEISQDVMVYVEKEIAFLPSASDII